MSKRTLNPSPNRWLCSLAMTNWHRVVSAFWLSSASVARASYPDIPVPQPSAGVSQEVASFVERWRGAKGASGDVPLKDATQAFDLLFAEICEGVSGTERRKSCATFEARLKDSIRAGLFIRTFFFKEGYLADVDGCRAPAKLTPSRQ